MKFGLIVPDDKNKTKQNTFKLPSKVASIFNDEDEDSEELELSALRKAAQISKSISTSDQFVAELHEEALKEDPNVFNYDAAIEAEAHGKNNKDAIKSGQFVKKESKAEPKYMQNILAKAEERKIESELIKLRNMKRKAQVGAEEKEGVEGAEEKEEEVFVTSAYRQRLQELEEKEKILKERQRHEEDGDVTKRKDMSGFYYNLMKRNVSFGGEDQKKRVKPVETSFNNQIEDLDLVIKKESEEIVVASSDEPVFGPRRPPIK